MPQLLSRVKGDARGISFDRNAGPGHHRPEVAQLAAQVIADWSQVDTYISGIFVAMLGANPAPGAAGFAALRSSSTQQTMLRAAAKVVLNDLQMDVLEGILSFFKRLTDGRNKIAHWVWGYTPDLPDRVLMCDPVHFVEYHAQYNEFQHARRRNQPIRTEPGISLDKVYVYEARDFIQLSDELQRLIALAVRFRNLLIEHVHTPEPNHLWDHPRYVREWNQLSNEPEIQKFVLRRRADRKKSQPAHL